MASPQPHPHPSAPTEPDAPATAAAAVAIGPGLESGGVSALAATAAAMAAAIGAAAGGGEAPAADHARTEQLLDDLLRVIDQYGRTLEQWRELEARYLQQIREKDEQIQRKTRLEELGAMAAGVAHEIRNPLGGIQLWASLLERDQEGSANVRRIAAKIGDAARHLNHVVQELLDFTHVPRPVFEPCSPAALARDAAALLAAEIAQRGARVRVEGDDTLSLRADPAMLRQVLLNLVSNAVQHSPAGGRVLVRLRREETPTPVCVLEVSDEGEGVPAEIRSQVFYPFFSRRPGGTGLGLAIVSRIVTAHAGAVTVGDAPGRGALFTVRLPWR
ncbi:MAG: hypothetical protein HY719_07070 [Planctomycetes bacterium]|nr:hypothetical protein [Planctomycetota bacterium]